MEFIELNTDCRSNSTEFYAAFHALLPSLLVLHNHIVLRQETEDRECSVLATEAVERLFALGANSQAVYIESIVHTIMRREGKERDWRRSSCDLLREVFGNPFRAVALNQSWLTATVRQLAATIYEEYAFDLMPALGDAIQRAGCDDQQTLEHCRNGAEHVKGCWVVDAVLQRE